MLTKAPPQNGTPTAWTSLDSPRIPASLLAGRYMPEISKTAYWMHRSALCYQGHNLGQEIPVLSTLSPGCQSQSLIFFSFSRSIDNQVRVEMSYSNSRKWIFSPRVRIQNPSPNPKFRSYIFPPLSPLFLNSHAFLKLEISQIGGIMVLWQLNRC